MVDVDQLQEKARIWLELEPPPSASVAVDSSAAGRTSSPLDDGDSAQVFLGGACLPLLKALPVLRWDVRVRLSVRVFPESFVLTPSA